MKSITKIELDLYAANGCQNPNCSHEQHGEIYLHARCHPDSDAEVRYVKSSGVLEISCSYCHKAICAVKVAAQ